MLVGELISTKTHHQGHKEHKEIQRLLGDLGDLGDLGGEIFSLKSDPLNAILDQQNVEVYQYPKSKPG
jgi:hypothetical protein